MKKLTLFLFSFIFLLSARGASANSGFELAPKNFFLQTSPGETIREVVTLKNLGSAPKTITLTWQGYRLPAGGFTNEVDLKSHSVDFALLSTNTLELQPAGTGAVEINFITPAEKSPADYYGSLLAKAEKEEEQSDFTVRILGKIEEKLELISFSDNGSTSTIKIANSGNQTTTVKVATTIRDFFGKTTPLATAKISLKAAEVKTLQINHKSLWPGEYQAKISLDSGTNQKVVFHSFWLHPEIFLIFGAIMVIVVLIFLAKLRKRK